MGTPINKLKAKALFALTNLVNQEYVSSGKNDQEFAQYAQAKLGMTFTGANVRTAREAVDLESNFTVNRKNSPEAIHRELQAAVTELQARQARLEDAMNTIVAEIEKRIKVLEGLVRVHK